MEWKKDKGLHFHRPVLNKKIRGWTGFVSFVNIGLSVAVVGLVVFNILFFLSKVELPTEIEPAAMEGTEKPTAVLVEAPGKAIADYTPISEKNIFSPDRKEWPNPTQVVQQPAVVETDKGLAKSSGLSLLGVIIAGDVKKALLRGKSDPPLFLKEGEEIDGYRLVGIEPKKVRMSQDGKEFSIGLYKDLTTISEEAREGTEDTEVSKWETPYPYEFKRLP